MHYEVRNRIMVERSSLKKGIAPRQDGPPIKVLVVDEHPLIRAGLVQSLAGLGQSVEVFQAGSVRDALAELAAHPDTTLTIADLTLPDAQGADVLERIGRAHAKVPLVVLSATDDRAKVLGALAQGAKGFISKRSSCAVLLSALRLVLTGDVYIPPEALRADKPPLPSSLEPTLQRIGSDAGLTERQLQVLALLMQGKPNKSIARALHVAEGTVRVHVAAILRRLGVANRTEAVGMVNRRGVDLPATAGTDVPHRTTRWRAADHDVNGAPVAWFAARTAPLAKN